MDTIKITNRILASEVHGNLESLLYLKPNEGNASVRYAIKRSFRSVQNAIVDYNKKRKEIFESYCKYNEGTPCIKKEKGSQEYEFQNKDEYKKAQLKLNALAEEVIELKVHKMKYADLVDLDRFNLGIEICLEKLIDFGEGEAKPIETPEKNLNDGEEESDGLNGDSNHLSSNITPTAANN